MKQVVGILAWMSLVAAISVQKRAGFRAGVLRDDVGVSPDNYGDEHDFAPTIRQKITHRLLWPHLVASDPHLNRRLDENQ
jgi:hypothetical protein